MQKWSDEMLPDGVARLESVELPTVRRLSFVVQRMREVFLLREGVFMVFIWRSNLFGDRTKYVQVCPLVHDS